MVGEPSTRLVARPVLFDLSDSNIKFGIDTLMNILRDRRHEGWVLAAYPDPKTNRPLIGAGFSLDVMATEHLQSDPLNPHSFLEPSSAQLWQAAGLDLDRLQRILDQFDHDLKTWGKKNFRRKIRAHTLQPEVSEDEANALLRISAMQAVYNARAYCHDFDQLTGPQQLALSQLVYQMGVNLGEFDQFLSTINREITAHDVSQTGERSDEIAHWKTVQRTLIESQWARHYKIRAASVIAMFDPDYVRDPGEAERRVQAILRPSRKHSHKRHAAGSLRAAIDQIPKMPSRTAGEYQSSAS
jgi:GH24 family phage-related lysozyme (muramidase)